MSRLKKIILITVCIVSILFLVLYILSFRPKPESIVYGSSFNTIYAEELGLDWKKVYISILDDLKVRHLRLASHWTMVEPVKDRFNFNELDFQIAEAEKRNTDIILSVGRRLPRWPECHIPEWAKDLSWKEQKVEIRELITAVVNRYKNNDAITHWQVENEPFLTVFAQEHCGDLDEDFLAEEINLVKELDNTRPVLVTDSGNLGLWAGAYKLGDSFGTSVYVYLWNEEIGPFKSIFPPMYYRIKYNIMRVLYGYKPSFLIELSVEPWLLQPVTDTPIDVQLDRMNIEKFNGIISYAEKTRFDRQYLWRAEWWYLMRQHGEESFWNRAKELYSTD